ncbi:uncharacterized protein YcfL [Flavobacterium sp. PL11]|uniref:hypothetical protein n=1 Tax=Flavobacterium sp. PL11 TaxID=3071717 RepID=UPI002DF8BFC5|nr:uncharacterized protein YcfL [Flavobacterium sp. PL11]
MKSKKNIDRLFQERFKDFESAPNDQTWSVIQVGLKDKKERRVIPIWIKYSGIAAAFLLGVFLLNTLFEFNIESENNIVIETKILDTKSKQKDSASVKNKTKINFHKDYKVVKNNLQTPNDDQKQNATFKKTKIVFAKPLNQKIVSNNNRKSDQTVKNENNSERKLNKDLLFNDEIIGKNDYLPQNISVKKNKNKMDIEKSDLVTDKIISSKDIITNAETENELEAILKNKSNKEIVIVNNLENKWQITPNVAAVFTNSNAVSIDPQFAENTKTTNNKLSYGVRLDYALNKKFTLRSGINKIAVGYNTNNVTYSSGLNTVSLANVKLNNNNMFEIRSSSGKTSLMTFERNLQKTNIGSINQSMSYYEIPLEISYSLLDKKIGINIIGGVSTLLLDSNKIALISSETNQQIGQANNLNSTIFSSNIGIGFNYQFIKSFQFNFEPMVKYQLNTFSNSSNVTTPILIGLYSGISYSF